MIDGFNLKKGRGLPFLWQVVRFFAVGLLLTHFSQTCDYNIYRPQQSCAKVIFLHVSVILYTGRSVP